MISSCSILRLNGAPTTMNTTKLSASTLTTSKTSEGNPTFSDMILNSVKTGKAEPSLLAMKKDAKDCKHVPLVMDGKNNSSTH